MDCTWDATEIKSKNGITHAYQYYALPMRMAVYQFPYENYDSLEHITPRLLQEAAIQNRATLLILRVEDTLYEDAFYDALGMDTDPYMPWVFDIHMEDGTPVFTLRNTEEE